MRIPLAQALVRAYILTMKREDMMSQSVRDALVDAETLRRAMYWRDYAAIEDHADFALAHLRSVNFDGAPKHFATAAHHAFLVVPALRA